MIGSSNDAITRVLRSARQRKTPAPSAGHALARSLVLRHGWNTLAYQILNPGIRHWFLAGGEGVVGYVDVGGAWVAAGAPICPPERLGAAAEAFEGAAARAGRRVCYVGAQSRLADAMTATGPIASLPIGAQPVWDPKGWPAKVAGKASLRAQLARARNKGVRVEVWPATTAAEDPDVRRCLDEWLATRDLPPLHFLVEPETLVAPEDRRVFVARRDRAVVAYLVATPIPQREGWLLEQVVRGRAALNGTAELLIDAAMHAFAAENASYVTLGVAPLSQRAPIPESPQGALVRSLLAWVRAHGRRFYNFEGLEAFKAKLQPDAWEPVYVLSRERTTSLRTLYAVAGAFADEPPPAFLARALIRAAAQELRWARPRLRRLVRRTAAP
jgi:phosphatidylglycerol lysyltransferase